MVFLNSIIYYYNINRRKLVEKDSPQCCYFYKREQEQLG